MKCKTSYLVPLKVLILLNFNFFFKRSIFESLYHIYAYNYKCMHVCMKIFEDRMNSYLYMNYI